MHLRLDWATAKAARYACENWHYACRYPAAKNVKIGAWEDGSFIGVVMFTAGSAGVGQLHKSLGLGPHAVCELQRVALREHRAEVTRIVSIALRMLKQQSPGLEMVISYADPAQGHTGAIYVAGNWHRFGKSSADKAYEYADGRVIHSRSVDERGFKKAFGETEHKCRRPSDAVRVVHLAPKHRFL